MIAIRVERGEPSPALATVIPFPLERRTSLLKDRFQAGIEELLQSNSVRLNGYKVGEMVVEEGLPPSFLKRLANYGFRPLAAGPATVNYSLVPYQGRKIYAVSFGDQEGHKIGLILDGDEAKARETDVDNQALYSEMESNSLNTQREKLQFGLSLLSFIRSVQRL